MTQPAGAPLFDAILRPHRSLGRKGLILLLRCTLSRRRVRHSRS